MDQNNDVIKLNLKILMILQYGCCLSSKNDSCTVTQILQIKVGTHSFKIQMTHTNKPRVQRLQNTLILLNTFIINKQYWYTYIRYFESFMRSNSSVAIVPIIEWRFC